MNLNDVSKREVLNFDDFRKKVHDYNYKPLAPSNQSGEGLSKSGISKIEREPAYDYVGYADSVFSGTSKIDVPSVRFNVDGKSGEMDATGFGTSSIMQTSESLESNFESQFNLKRLCDF